MSPVARWAVRALRDLGLNVLGFALVFAVVMVAAGAWATLFGLVRKYQIFAKGRAILKSDEASGAEPARV